MTIYCLNCDSLTKHLRIGGIVKDKRLHSNGYHYWQKVQCSKCQTVSWTDRRRDGS